jgi:hypothetical protein
MSARRISPRFGAAPLVLAALLGLAAPVALSGCKRAPVAAPAIRSDARLTAWRGAVEIDRAGTIIPASKDAPLLAGDLVRTGAGAEARLGFDNGQTVRLGERALLRLGRDPASSLELTVIVGQADVEGAPKTAPGDHPRPLQIVTPSGPVRLAPGGRLRVKALSDRTHYELMVGQASLTGADAALVTLVPGDGLSIAIGGSVLERYHIQLGASEVETIEASDPDKSTAAADEDSPAEPAGAGSPGNEAAVAPTSNGIDVTISAGETATVHSEGRAAALVRFRLPVDCPASTAILRGLPRDPRKTLTTADAGFVSARLPPGYFAYRLICAGRQRARGTLTIRSDTGLATLPRRPPRNRLDADGRRYTVLFQNLLPTFELSWPHAPTATTYVLHVQTRGRAHTWPSSAPALELRPGAVAEGEHTWWWSTADGRRSATTTLTLKFDNAALAAEIQSPRPQQAGLPDPISGSVPAALEVAGTTLPGSRVTVDDVGLPLDAQGRFRAEIPLPAADRRALAIRIEHRRTGVHYYLRRLAGR